MGKAVGRLVAFVVQRDKRLFICPRPKEKSKPFRPCVQTLALYAKKEKEKIRWSVRRFSVTQWPVSVCPENHFPTTKSLRLLATILSCKRGWNVRTRDIQWNYRIKRSYDKSLDGESSAGYSRTRLIPILFALRDTAVLSVPSIFVRIVNSSFGWSVNFDEFWWKVLYRYILTILGFLEISMNFLMERFTS